ncbi:MAG: alkaline phosphatase D family protein [Candidatus Rokubacteria bacterium]|nr:alkaline phosphatase D family protein [Candidatus Rokubacteria bacterium]
MPAFVSLVLVLGCLVVGLAHAAERLLVTVGEVTASGAVLWVRGPGAGRVTVDLTGPGAAGRVERLALVPERDLTGRVVLAGLRPAGRYQYRVRGDGETVAGTFTTAPARDDAQPVAFLWSGDLGGGGFCRPADGGYPIFGAMARRPADFFLFVGDTIYADRPCNGPGVARGADFVATTLAGFHARHRYNREDAAVQSFLRRTSVYAIWDDHEVRNDFAGSVDPLMPVGRQAFLDYWPLAPPADDPARLYRRARWGELAELFILDTRQYRSPNAERDGPTKTMLGAAQRRWLVEGVVRSTARWKFVVSSVSLSVPTGRRERRDSWTGVGPFGLPIEQGTGFATERDAILRQFREARVRNLVVIAADVHHAEIIRHEPWPGYRFHELIAGPLSATHGAPRPLDQALGGRTLWARGGLNNFGEVTVERDRLTVRILDEVGSVLTTQEIPAE